MGDGGLFSFTIKSVECDVSKVVKRLGIEEKGRVQQYIDSEVLRLCDPYIPFDIGTLRDSGITNTVIGSGEVKWRTPYARRWYYMPANFEGAPMRGNYWFERMKRQGGKEQILNGVKKMVGAK